MLLIRVFYLEKQLIVLDGELLCQHRVRSELGCAFLFLVPHFSGPRPREFPFPRNSVPFSCETSSPFLKSPSREGSWGIPFIGEFRFCVPAKCPNSGSLMAMGLSGNEKTQGTPHGGKKINVQHMLELLLRVLLNT